MIERLKRIYHYFWALFSALWYAFPSNEIFVIGITGTKGKSTSVALINSVLQQAGYKTAYFSSVEVVIGDSVTRNISGNTMPGRFFIQRFLRRAVKAGCQYVIMEVTSQGVVQHRHRFIHFDAVGMTGLHPEHIEAHGSFENYRDAKLSFFSYGAKQSHPPIFFINNESPYRHAFEGAARYGHKKGSPRIVFYRRETTERMLRSGGSYVNEVLASDFNLENASLAAAIGLTQGISHEVSKEALVNFSGITGRMEFIRKKGYPDVLVDYAHTPGSFEAVYKYIREKIKPKRLITVFGSYGEGRDKWKRPRLGEVSAEYCDEVIITNEGPGDEDPQEIVEQIASGVKKEGVARIILDREEAIRYAISMAEEGDVVALLGKGHEDYIRIGKTKIPWNEKKLVEDIFSEEDTE